MFLKQELYILISKSRMGGKINKFIVIVGPPVVVN